MIREYTVISPTTRGQAIAKTACQWHITLEVK